MTSQDVPNHSLARRARSRTRLDPARQIAFAALRAVDDDDAYLNLTLPSLLAAAGLTGRDAALATELANGTIRMQGLYDAMISASLSGAPASLQPEVLTALRLGAHQLHGMRVPSHAAVGTSVELVREAVGERPVRLVNAVLRRIGATPLDGWLETLAPRATGGSVDDLVVRFSHPAWIVDAFADALTADGADAAQLPRLLAADNEAPRVTLAARPGLTTVTALSSYDVRPGRFSPYAGILGGGDPADLPEVRKGTVGVQDEGSQLAALVLARASLDRRDTRWLDMCSGPGGKAALLTGLARQRGATLVAAEMLPHRAVLVGRAVRAYPPPHALVVADGAAPAWRPGAFDRVLVDAPCTGLGALRRRPEARWRRQPDDLRSLVPLQRRLLDSAIDSTRPGGVVAYVTCSPHRAETRGVVDAILARRPDVQEDDARALLPQVDGTGPGPHIQLWPHRHGTDAMFVALLRRR
ncbi:MAG: RsmB/NOP family class I SAM-dependent RNA methyltransferase [Lapillicoccus sp.]